MNPTEEKEAREIIRKIVLLNALRYEGKATPKPVFGKLLGEHPQFRRQIKEVTTIINEIVQEINELLLEKQREIVAENWPEALVEEKTEETKQLPPLLNAKKYGQVVTRFSPNPDFVLHLGSARAILLSYDYAKMYNGLFYLRFEDTDSKTKKPKLEFYEAIREDLKWLGCKWDAEFIQSDRLPIYYQHSEEIIKTGGAYVCTCIREDFQEKTKIGQSCPCRELSADENLFRWNRMLDGTYGEGEAVVRIKTTMNHPNPAVRDWPALRIVDTEKYPHPRVGSKYRVWPLYNFSTGIDDHLMGITHIIRGKEHLTNQTRQEYMYRHFGWKYPETIHYGRLKITGASLSKSEIVKGMDSGLYKHWDDPRLATIAALRKRGITAEAIHSLIIDVGPKPQDVVLSWKNLYAHNRKQIDPNAKRYFFVQDPVKLVVDEVPYDFMAQIPLHPDHSDRGVRCFEVKPEKGKAVFLISKDDVEGIASKNAIRFMDLFNFKVKKIEQEVIQAIFLGESYEEAKKLGAPLIHWIPFDSGFPCEVVMPDASVDKGIAEDACRVLRPNEIVQFQRFGFARVDRVNEKLTAYFAHR
ncbi:glutamate--tRNA ligase [Candidatus Bathyarchaeota archaeon]|nr:glutamate--tRNA ligase [Candidatus Bathyarchaeota archaeon]